MTLNGYIHDPNMIVYPDHIQFGVLSNNEVLEMSVIRDEKGKLEPMGINRPELLDNSEPKRGGLIDLRFGTMDNNTVCHTCGLLMSGCSGHPGHIQLANPVFNIPFLENVKKILSCVCLQCSKLLIFQNEDQIQKMLQTKTGSDRLKAIVNLTKRVKHCQKANSGCGAPVTTIKKEIKKSTGTITISSEIEMPNEKKKKSVLLTPELIYIVLKNISDTDCKIMGLDPKESRPENLIVKNMHVPPVTIRPSTKGSFMGGETTTDNLTKALADIIKANLRIHKYKETNNEKFQSYSKENRYILQFNYGVYIDNDSISKKKMDNNERPIKSLISKLGKKEGRFRGNLEAKRCEFTARTVITPDPTLDLNQVGVPKKIAMMLTMPVTVTESNKEELTKLIQNGKKIYPGANVVYKYSDFKPGDKIQPVDLRYGSEKIELKPGYVVERHLQDGDYLLLNRQPSLHKISMMGHISKIVDNDDLMSIRLSVAVVQPYNADFDGDEMNIFLPQSLLPLIELKYLADAKYHIISPGSGKTIMGLSNDTLEGSYLLSLSGMTKDDFGNEVNMSTPIDWRSAMNILGYTSSTRFNEIKKEGSYIGYDLVSLILPETANYSFKDIVIKNGKFIAGTLNSSALGTGAKNNIIKYLWDAYNADTAKMFIDDMQRLANNFNLYRGFTVGLDSILVSEKINDEVQKMFAKIDLELAISVTMAENNPNIMDLEIFESKVFNLLNPVLDRTSEMVINQMSSSNNFNIMVKAGKGKPSNIGQMCACVGLLSSQGMLIKKLYNGRTTPYFYTNDNSASARGLVKNSYYTGVDFREFYFVLRVGREGSIDGAIKTADTGYVQRKLIKTFEDDMVKYDKTVRTATDTVISLVYGEIGTEAIYQYEYDIKLLLMNNEQLEQTHKFTDDELKKYKNYSKEINNKTYEMIKDMRDDARNIILKTSLKTDMMQTTFVIPININRFIANYSQTNDANDKFIEPQEVLELLNGLLTNEQTMLMCLTKKDKENNSLKMRDEQLFKSMLKLSLFNALSPKIVVNMKMTRNNFNKMIREMSYSYNANMVSPGEMVGLVAAQSVGEPITQMCVDGDSYIHIVHKYDENKNYDGDIRTFVENMFKENDMDIQYINNDKKSDILDVKDYYTVSIDLKTEKIVWSEIAQLSRHNANGDMVEVITESGRKVITTLTHAHLSRTEKGIMSVEASTLKINDYIPIVNGMPSCDDFMMIIPSPIVISSDKSRLYDILAKCSYSDKKYVYKNNNELQFKKDMIHLMKYSLYGEIVNNSYVIDEEYIKGGKLDLEGIIPGTGKYWKAIDIDRNDDMSRFGLLAVSNKINDENAYNGLYSDVKWDRIININIIRTDPLKKVYDMSIPSTANFVTSDGIFVHNTLKAFHFAGLSAMSTANLGVPRLKEILSSTSNIKTPIMIIKLLDSHENNIETTKKIASYFKYTSLGDIAKNYNVYYDKNPLEKGGLSEQDNVKFFDKSLKGCNVGLNDNLKSVESVLVTAPIVIRIELNKEKMLEREISMTEIKAKLCSWWKKKDNTDAKTNKDKKILNKILTFLVLGNSDTDTVPVLHLRINGKSSDKLTDTFDIDTISSFMTTILDQFKLKGMSKIQDAAVVPQDDNLAKSYKFDKKTGDKINITNNLIFTRGADLIGIRYINGIDPHQTISNDIVHVYEVFGIEIARAVLFNEFRKIFVDEGKVSDKHVLTIVDHLTSLGFISSVDRYSVNKSDTDPLAKATFEKTPDHLVDAAMFAKKDRMKCLSSRVMAGLVTKAGSGFPNVVLDNKKLEISEHLDEYGRLDESKKLETSNVTRDVLAGRGTQHMFIPE